MIAHLVMDKFVQYVVMLKEQLAAFAGQAAWSANLEETVQGNGKRTACEKYHTKTTDLAMSGLFVDNLILDVRFHRGPAHLKSWN